MSYPCYIPVISVLSAKDEPGKVLETAVPTRIQCRWGNLNESLPWQSGRLSSGSCPWRSRATRCWNRHLLKSRSAKVVKQRTENQRNDDAHNQRRTKVLPVTLPVGAPHAWKQIVPVLLFISFLPKHSVANDSLSVTPRHRRGTRCDLPPV